MGWLYEEESKLPSSNDYSQPVTCSLYMAVTVESFHVFFFVYLVKLTKAGKVRTGTAGTQE